MQKYIFKKDGLDNAKIIEAITVFILRSYSSKSQLLLNTQYLHNKILKETELLYTITDVYPAINDIRCNTVLQFHLGEMLPLCADKSIWISDETEVTIETNEEGITKSFTFMDKSVFDGNPTYRKLKTLS